MRKTELHVRLLEGKLHRAADVERIWSQMATAVKGRLLSIPVKLAPQVAGLTDRAEIQRMVAREVEDALNEIAAYDPADYVQTDDSDQDLGEEDEDEETDPEE